MNANVDSWLDNYFDFNKDELQIRVESLKIELDEVYTKLSSQMDNEKIKTKENVNKMSVKVDRSIRSAKELIANFESSKKPVYFDDNSLVGLDELEFDLTKTIQSMKFKPNEEKITASLIGELTNVSLYEAKNPKSNIWDLYNFEDDLFDTRPCSNDDEDSDDDDDCLWEDCDSDDDDEGDYDDNDDFANDLYQMMHWDKEDRNYEMFSGGYGDEDDDDDCEMFASNFGANFLANFHKLRKEKGKKESKSNLLFIKEKKGYSCLYYCRNWYCEMV